MKDALHRLTLFAVYQLTLVAGIALLPLALLARRVGVSLPVGSAVDAVTTAYDDAGQ